MKSAIIGMLCLLVLSGSRLQAAGRALPDNLTLNVGAVDNVGTNVTVVLAKRSMRAEDFRCFLLTDEGVKAMDPLPVCTYRGHVQEDPLIAVNGNIEPGGMLNLNFTENRGIIARIRGMKIAVPEGRCTPGMSTGLKVVPLASLAKRQVPTPAGYLVPEVLMRRTRWVVRVTSSYTSKCGIENAVCETEQRMNDADFIYARDLGTAWEIDTMVVWDPAATGQLDLKALYPDSPGRLKNCRLAGFNGPGAGNQGLFQLNVGSVVHEAWILLHESAHVYGHRWHQLDQGDGLCGGGAFWGSTSVELLLQRMKSLNATNFPGVIYTGALPPHAMYDIANTRKDTPVTINVLENDYDGNGDAISLQAVQSKSDQGGSVAVSKEGKAVYTPAPGFVGLDRFSYTVVDSTGIGNRSGQVKVDVRGDGLAAYFDFEDPEKELRPNTARDGKEWHYGAFDRRPESDRWLYHFRNLGPYVGGRSTAHWIDYVPVNGVRGKGLLNPGLLRMAQVELGDIGDPGRDSLSASIWALYPDAAQVGGVLLCKGASPWGVVNGWSISASRDGFRFEGNSVRLVDGEKFGLQSQEPIQSNTWYHLVMVIDRDTNKLRAWVNNTEVTTPTTTADIPEGAIEYFGQLHLFNSYGHAWWGASKVLVDELKIFTSALTPKQVAELYAEGKNAEILDLKNTAGK